MSALDELRRMLREDAADRLRYEKTEFIATEAAVKTVDSFEAAHPGLVDKTVACPRCGKPTLLNGRHKDKRLGYWREVCPACAKEATA